METQVVDLAALSGLPDLNTLCLSGKSITDLSPLSRLQNLRELSIDWNPIRGNLAPLAGLANLRLLHACYCEVNEISALARLTHLEELWLAGNQITDLAPLLNHVRLRALTLNGNPLRRLAVDTQIPQIRANNPTIDIFFGARVPPQ
jgi:internalin A